MSRLFIVERTNSQRTEPGALPRYIVIYTTNVIHDGLSMFGRSYLRSAGPILEIGVSTVDGAWCTMVRTTHGSQQQLALIEIPGKFTKDLKSTR
jgi:hypothetical protein